MSVVDRNGFCGGPDFIYKMHLLVTFTPLIETVLLTINVFNTVLTIFNYDEHLMCDKIIHYTMVIDFNIISKIDHKCKHVECSKGDLFLFQVNSGLFY
jgi:hypothetical protein